MGEGGRAGQPGGNRAGGESGRLTSFVLVMVSAMMLAAPGSSVTGMKGREEAPEADGVIADEGVTASSDEGTCSHKKQTNKRGITKTLD